MSYYEQTNDSRCGHRDECEYPDCGCPITFGSGDMGSAFITREKDGTVTMRVRSPSSHNESAINMTWENWISMREIGCIPKTP